MSRLLEYAERDQDRGFEVLFKEDNIIVTLTQDFMTVSSCIKKENSS